MSITISLARLSTYYRRHGFRATAQRGKLALSRALFSRGQIVFACDLEGLRLPHECSRSLWSVERRESYTALGSEVLHEMLSFWNPALAEARMKERFGKRASLWLVKVGEHLAGYGWTLQGRTIQPHPLTLGAEDVHFFDFYVFPQYRGRGINPLLVNHVLRTVAAARQGRAFIEVAPWNEAQLRSLAKTPFRRLGRVTTLPLCGRRFVRWNNREEQAPHNSAVRRDLVDSREKLRQSGVPSRLPYR